MLLSSVETDLQSQDELWLLSMTTETQRLLSISCFHHWRDTSSGEQKIDGVIWSPFLQENRPTGGESNETEFQILFSWIKN